MFASSQLDPVIGLDIHMEMVPTPAGPVPTPFPMPFVGVITFSPIEALVDWGMAKALSWATDTPAKGPVFVNGFRATKTGNEASNAQVLPHMVIPPGTMWTPLPKPLKLKPKPPPPAPDNPAQPAGDAVMVTGSQTVYFEGLNACRLGTLAMSCGDPVRLPSSTLLAIPKGAPVLVGGPPAFDFTATAKSLFLRNKWTSGALHQLVSRLAPGRLRALLRWSACFLTGHPVDVATGRLLTRAEDFALRGPLPIRFERHYGSSWAERDSPIGFGWSHTYDERVWLERGRVVYKAGDGREIEFDTLHFPGHRMRAGDETFYPIDRLWLRCLGGGRWTIRTSDGIAREFAPLPGDAIESYLVEIRSRAGHWQRLLYDEKRRLSRIETSEGRSVRLEHRGRRLRRVAVPNPDGDGWIDQVTFEYSDDGDLLRAIDAHGKATAYRYEWHLLIQETDRDGVSFWFEYDGRDSTASCVRTWGNDGNGQDRLFFREITYDKRGGKTLVEDSLGHVTMYTMNVANAVVEVIDPHGAKTTYEYDVHLRKTAETNALGEVERHEYDARGNETRCTLRNGATVTIEYDARDRPVRMIDPREVEWTWAYDDRGRLVWRGSSAGAPHTLAIEYEGLYPARIVRPDGNVVRTRFDEHGDLREVLYPDGHVEKRRYDRLSRLVRVRDRSGVLTTFAYDRLSRLCHVNEAGVERFATYTNEGDLASYQDSVRHVELTYAAFHRLATKTEGGTRVRYAYSSEAELVAIFNEADEMAMFERDACGRVQFETGFDGRRRQYMRDPLGRVKELLSPDGTSQKLDYDASGDVTKITYGDGSEERFTYSVLGELETATNAAGTVAFERDAAGRLVRERFCDDWIEQQLDALGQRIGVTTSRGLSERIERGTEGHVRSLVARDAASAATWAATFDRDPLGRELERRLPGGVVSRCKRDGYGRPVQHVVSSGEKELSRTEYRWRGPATIESIADSVGGDAVLEHDARGRLSAVLRFGAPTEYRRPDATGNVYRSPDRSDRVYGKGGVLLEDRGTRFAYDANGNRIERVAPDGATWRYAWDGAGHLRTVERPDGKRVELEYDALGRRVAKRFEGRETRWRWDGATPAHEWDDVGADVAWLFGPGTFEPIGYLPRAARPQSIVGDPLGAPQRVIDDVGASLWSGRVDAFGDAVSKGVQPEATIPWRFPGQYADDETGLSYNGFRYYDPSIGAYVSQDPIRFQGGIELYGYVPDPTTWMDPLGLAGAAGCERRQPARQIEAAWSASTYRHGGLMTGIEHIMYRHSSISGFANVSRFAPGTRARDIVGYVDEALRRGVVTETSPGAYMVEHGMGQAIGTNIAGEAASSIRIFVRAGIIQTAFPF